MSVTRLPTLLLVGALFVGCGTRQFEESDVENYRFDTDPAGSEPPRIEVVLDAGSVEIVASPSATVEATVLKRARAFDPEVARRFLARVEIDAIQEGNRVRVTGRSDPTPSASWGTDLRSEVTLRVPEKCDVDLRTGDGRLRLEGVRGRIVAETGDGRIELTRASGSVFLRTGDGSITGRQLEGEADVFTGDGRIELDGRFSRLRAVTGDGSIRVVGREPTGIEGDWVLRTGDGSISLALPPSISAEIDAMTSDGTIENHLSALEGSEGDGYLRGKIGGGGPRIVVSTMDGRIELTEN